MYLLDFSTVLAFAIHHTEQNMTTFHQDLHTLPAHRLVRLGGNGRENPSRPVVLHLPTPPRPTHHCDRGAHSPKPRIPACKRAQSDTDAVPTGHTDVG